MEESKFVHGGGGDGRNGGYNVSSFIVPELLKIPGISFTATFISFITAVFYLSERFVTWYDFLTKLEKRKNGKES